MPLLPVKNGKSLKKEHRCSICSRPVMAIQHTQCHCHISWLNYQQRNLAKKWLRKDARHCDRTLNASCQSCSSSIRSMIPKDCNMMYVTWKKAKDWADHTEIGAKHSKRTWHQTSGDWKCHASKRHFRENLLPSKPWISLS